MPRPLGRSRRLTVSAIAASCLTIAALLGTAVPAQAAASPSKIAITATSTTSKSKVVKGDKLTLSGWTSANLRNQVLNVYVVRGKNTAALGVSTRVNSASKFKVTIPVNQNAGSVKYVLRFAGTRTLAKSQAVQGIYVWQWFPLTEQEIVDEANYSAMSTVSNVHVAGTRYPSAIAEEYWMSGDDSTWSEWNLGYHCTTFSSKFGVTDESESGSHAAMSVSTDGTTRYSTDVGVGQVRGTWFDITGSFRLRLTAQSTASPRFFPAFPVARVLCSVNPNPAA